MEETNIKAMHPYTASNVTALCMAKANVVSPGQIVFSDDGLGPWTVACTPTGAKPAIRAIRASDG